MNTVIAAADWAEASIWIAVILAAGIVTAVAIHSVMRVGRSAVETEGSSSSKRTNELLETMSSDLADVRMRLTEVERLLKDV